MRIGGQAFGWGAGIKEGDMYEALVKIYNENKNEGDRDIDIIGFSRGAVMAMQFAQKIEKEGIPDKKNGGKFCPTIRFLGLFDPVPGPRMRGVGMLAPSNIPDIVQHTSIAYSADENREAFAPVFPGGKNITTAIFKGVHSDIGGGYRQRGLANVAMGWMVEQGRAAGAPFNTPSLDGYDMTDEPVIHQETAPPPNHWLWSTGIPVRGEASISDTLHVHRAPKRIFNELT